MFLYYDIFHFMLSMILLLTLLLNLYTNLRAFENPLAPKDFYWDRSGAKVKIKDADMESYL